MTISFSDINSAAQLIWTKLDAMDNTDGITKSVWDKFRATGVNAKSIKWCIKKENGLKSIKYYLKNANDTVKQKICDLCGFTIEAPKTVETPEVKDTLKVKDDVKTNEQALREILDNVNLEITDEEYLDILTKYENKLALKDSLGFTDEQIAQDIVNYVNAKQKYNPIEDSFANAGNQHYSEKIDPQNEAELNAEIKKIHEQIHQMYPELGRDDIIQATMDIISNGESNIAPSVVSNYAKKINDTDLQPYVIDGIQEALEYAKEHPEDIVGAYEKQSEAYQRFGNSQVQLYDSNGDNKISEEEFVAHEEQRAGIQFDDEEKEIAQKRFNVLASSVTDDNVIDAQEMTLHGYATAKMYDNKNVKSGHDVTYKEWLAANDALETKASGSKDDISNRYDELVNLGKDVIYNYHEKLQKK